MNAAKPVIRSAATLILVAKNSHLKSYFDYRILLLERGTKSQFMVCTLQALIMYRSIPKPPIPPRANTQAFDFFEKFWSNSPLCCQFRRSNAPSVRASRGSNIPSSRHVKATVETSSAKFSAARNFLLSLSSLHKGIFHDIST